MYMYMCMYMYTYTYVYIYIYIERERKREREREREIYSRRRLGPIALVADVADAPHEVHLREDRPCLYA